MSKDVIIGIDAGTSVIKSIAFDLDGKPLASSAKPNSYDTDSDGAATQDMDRTWADCIETLAGLVEKLPGLPARTAAVAVTAQGDGTWLLDKDDRPVGDGWLWLDARSAPTVARLDKSSLNRRRFEFTGTGLNVCQQGSQLAHMAATTPEVLDAADVAMHCKDWLYLNLTGVRCTDPTEANFTFGNFRTRSYEDEVIEALGLMAYRRLLPGIVDGSQQTHPLEADAARVTGLLAGTPVSLGYVDVACTALGAGIYTGGEPAGCTVIGSTGMHMRANAVEDVRLNDDGTGYVMVLPIPNIVSQMQSNMAATMNIDWILSVAAGLLGEMGVKVDKADLIDRVGGWVERSAPGTLLYHPYISEAGERGPFIDHRARASFSGLNTSHGFADMVRAVLEGLGFAARDCYSAMGELPPEVRLTGGAGRSKALRSILAGCLNRPLRASMREEAGAAGAAMMAATAIGVFPTMNDCISEWVTPLLGERELPDPALAALYERQFRTYVSAREAMAPVWPQLSGRA